MTLGFCCPKCKQTLVTETDRYFCKNCNCFYPICDGYTDFLPDVEFYAGEVSQKEMKVLLENLDSLGFNEGLSRFLKQHPSLHDYITDFRRTDWLCHCLSNNNFRCLDIGSGLGNISNLLSKNFKEVYSLEAVKERIEFQKRRYKNSNSKNIKVVRGNALELPFEDNFFDLVICNGLLEWIGMMNTNLDPRDTQLAFLREVKRVLSKNGCLYIGIENRFGIQFFLGARDHSGLKYTSLLPRSLANYLVKRFGQEGGIYGDKSKKKKEKNGYYTYTYSAWGYQSLFRDACFKTKSFWVYPSYNEPLFSGKLEDKIGTKSFLRIFKNTFTKFKIGLSLMTKLDKSIIGLIVKFFSPSFLFYCYKENYPESLEEIISKNTDLKNFTTLSTGNDILYLLYDKNGNSKKAVRLKRFGKNFPTTLSYHDKTKPQSYDESERVWIEDWFSAKEANPLNLEDMIKSINWLFDFQKETSRGIMTKNDIQLEVTKIRDNLTELPHFNSQQYRKLIDDYQTYMESLKIIKTVEHGDFWHGNILIDLKTHQVYVVDWEYYREDGNPFHDLVFLLINGMKISGDNLEEFKTNFYGNGKFTPIMIELKNKINKHFGFEINLHILIPYVILCFIVKRQLERGQFDKSVITYKKMLDFLLSKK